MTAYSRDSDVEYVHMNWQVPVDVIGTHELESSG